MERFFLAIMIAVCSFGVFGVGELAGTNATTLPARECIGSDVNITLIDDVLTAYTGISGDEIELITVFDGDGIPVYVNENCSGTSCSCDLSGLSSGSYLVKVETFMTEHAETISL